MQLRSLLNQRKQGERLDSFRKRGTFRTQGTKRGTIKNGPRIKSGWTFKKVTCNRKTSLLTSGWMKNGIGVIKWDTMVMLTTGDR